MAKKKTYNERLLGYICLYVGRCHLRRFEKWAFGQKYDRDKDIDDMEKFWNHLHGKEYELPPGKMGIDNIEKMSDMWKESCERLS